MQPPPGPRVEDVETPGPFELDHGADVKPFLCRIAGHVAPPSTYHEQVPHLGRRARRALQKLPGEFRRIGREPQPGKRLVRSIFQARVAAAPLRAKPDLLEDTLADMPRARTMAPPVGEASVA